MRPLSFGLCVLVCVQCLVHVAIATDKRAASVPALSLPHRGSNQTDSMSLHPRAGLLQAGLRVPARGRNRTGKISLPNTKVGLLEQAHNHTTNDSKTAANTTVFPSRAQLPADDTQHDPSNVKRQYDYSFIESMVNISKHSDASRPIDNTLVLLFREMLGRVLGVAPPQNTTAHEPDNATRVSNTPKRGQENAHHEPLPKAPAHIPPFHFRHTRREPSAAPQKADPMHIHTVPRPSLHKGDTKHTQTPR